MKKIIYILLAFLFAYNNNVAAQELNSKVTINIAQLQGADTEMFKTLQDNLTQLINEYKWTDATFRANERIDCTFTITIADGSDGIYSGDIQITSRRPVYNSSYVTSMFNFKDSEFAFSYNRENLEYNETNITSNLIAMMSFYVYVVIGLDFDSYSLGGGRPYFEQALSIANSAQSLNQKGWRPFDNDRNRYSLALALTEESSRNFHSMWYNYHRLGLDEMAGNADRARTKVIETLEDLNALYGARPQSVLISFYGDTKLDELFNIYTKATREEKDKAHKLLQKIYPTKSSVVDKFKN